MTASITPDTPYNILTRLLFPPILRYSLIGLESLDMEQIRRIVSRYKVERQFRDFVVRQSRYKVASSRTCFYAVFHLYQNCLDFVSVCTWPNTAKKRKEREKLENVV